MVGATGGEQCDVFSEIGRTRSGRSSPSRNRALLGRGLEDGGHLGREELAGECVEFGDVQALVETRALGQGPWQSA